jgi:hypothetical protein
MEHRKLPLFTLLLASLSCGIGCSKHESGPTTAARAQETSGTVVTQTEALKAKVLEVDAAKRVVTLRDEQGQVFALDIGESVDLSSIKPNDSVRVVYQESVAFALTDKEEADIQGGPAVEQSTRQIPEGVQFGRKVTATVEIVSVTKDGSHATFRVPDGAQRTVYVDDQPSQQKIRNLRPGDAVAVTYTEKLAVAVDPAFDD